MQPCGIQNDAVFTLRSSDMMIKSLWMLIASGRGMITQMGMMKKLLGKTERDQESYTMYRRDKTYTTLPISHTTSHDQCASRATWHIYCGEKAGSVFGFGDLKKERNNSLPCPLPGSCLIASTIRLVQVCNIGYKRIIGVGIGEHRADRK